MNLVMVEQLKDKVKNVSPYRAPYGNPENLSDGLLQLVRSMYSANNANKGSAVSTMIYGVCWDETVRFIKKNYPNIEKVGSWSTSNLSISERYSTNVNSTTSYEAVGTRVQLYIK